MRKICSILLVLLWMGFIFIMSSFNASESSRQSGVIVNLLVNLFNINDLELFSTIIRKMAHFTEYFVLGFLVYNMIRKYDKLVYIGIIICILYAISDEVHQVLIPGRSFQIMDILIDILGALVAILIFRKITE